MLAELASYENIDTKAGSPESIKKKHAGERWSQSVTESMRAKARSVKQGSVQWHEMRRFGGTHAQIACGVDYNKTAAIQWRMDTLRMPEPEPSDTQLKARVIGHESEEWNARVYSAVMNTKLETVGLLHHDKYEWATVSPDRLPGFEAKAQMNGQNMIDKKGVPITSRKNVVQSVFAMEVMGLKHYDVSSCWRSFDTPRPDYYADVSCVRIFAWAELASEVMTCCKAYAESVVKDFSCPDDSLCPSAPTRFKSYVKVMPLFRVEFRKDIKVTRFGNDFSVVRFTDLK